MHEWRVTKYDPRLRDSSGAFRGDEWTSASEIGGSFGGIPLDVAAYLQTEDQYLAAATHFMSEAGVSSLTVLGLETADPLPLPGDLARLLTDGPPLHENERLSGAAVERAIRLNLRSLLWCRLEQPGIFFLHFGHDYYMYLGSLSPCPASARYAREIGLFAEPLPSPYRVSR